MKLVGEHQHAHAARRLYVRGHGNHRARLAWAEQRGGDSDEHQLPSDVGCVCQGRASAERLRYGEGGVDTIRKAVLVQSRAKVRLAKAADLGQRSAAAAESTRAHLGRPARAVLAERSLAASVTVTAVGSSSCVRGHPWVLRSSRRLSSVSSRVFRPSRPSRPSRLPSLFLSSASRARSRGCLLYTSPSPRDAHES
eukprot:368328-Prymnesium_polylepis.4